MTEQLCLGITRGVSRGRRLPLLGPHLNLLHLAHVDCVGGRVSLFALHAR